MAMGFSPSPSLFRAFAGCHRIKYVCKACGKTFTIPLKRAMVGEKLTYLGRATMLAKLGGLRSSPLEFTALNGLDRPAPLEFTEPKENPLGEPRGKQDRERAYSTVSLRSCASMYCSFTSRILFKTSKEARRCCSSSSV